MSVRQFVKHLARKNSSSLRTYARTLSYSFSPAQNHHESRPPETTSTSTQFQDNDPYALMKEDPVEICSSMWVKAFSSRTTGSAPNLTGFLAKFDLWVMAYQRTVAYVTGAFPRRTAIDSQVLNDLLSLRNAVIHGRFTWNDKIDQLIRSPNDKSSTKPLSNTKLRALIASDEPCFQDRVVQEVLLMVLEPVFEARFSPKSHGFRPNRNAHTVIRTIRSNFAGYLWYLRGDLTEIFETLDPNVAMSCLEKTIKDKKITKLVKSGLNSPLRGRFRVERDPEPPNKKKRGSTKKRILNYDDPKPDPFWLRTFFGFSPEEASKVPFFGCLGILSPLIVNVCLDELDKFVEQKAAEFYRPGSFPDKSHNPSWPEFVPSSESKGESEKKTRKMDYLRYGAHFLIGVRGARREAMDLRKKITAFCESRLGLSLDNSKVEIEHVTRGVEFVDHVISRRVVHPTLRYTSSGGGVVSEKGVGTLLSVTGSLPRCIRHFKEMRFVEGDRDPDPLPCTPMMYSGQAHTNAQMNRFLETMADWFRYADNRKKLVGFCAYVIRSSLAKLYAARYRLKSRAKVYGIASRDLSRPLIEKTNNSAPEYSDLIRMGLVDAIEGVRFSHMSLIPSCDYAPFPRDWAPHHERLLREYISLDTPKNFCDLHIAIRKKQGLSLPQEEMSETVWDFKTLGVKHRIRRLQEDEARDRETCAGASTF